MCTSRKQYGITPPISTTPPTPREEELTASLKAEMIARGAYESAEESKLRYAFSNLAYPPLPLSC